MLVSLEIMPKFYNTKKGRTLTRNQIPDVAVPRIIYSGGRHQFQSEAALEQYVEDHLSSLFPDLELLERQFTIRNQRCDLVCGHRQTRQLVVIELKNEMDRGVVPQLIRYRECILDEKPFADQIDYNLSLLMIAIAPEFHEDNYTDQRASKYESDITLLPFSINDDIKFVFEDKEYEIPYSEGQGSTADPDAELMSLPEILFNAKAMSGAHRESFLALRKNLIDQPKIEEFVTLPPRTILYGNGSGEKSKKLAEIRDVQKGLFLFLWLPTCDRLPTVKEPKERFGLVVESGVDPFDLNSHVEYLVCSKNGINEKDRGSRNRRGTPTWIKAERYLVEVGLHTNTFFFLMRLLKGLTPPLGKDVYDQCRREMKETPTHLGWFLDLALKMWVDQVK